ncbi:MAG: tetratricopeptide repeat protein [Myxococcales bacterium]|nr:tetratricopeptide repeat protein [Myxococcales bacterium]
MTWCIAILINSPHYGATLLRIYEHREERRKYALFAVWATLLIGLAFVVALHQPFVGALLVTVFLSWSPWHFAGQNYGISLMFLRRSGVEITPWAKRLLYASFLLSFALTFLALHVEGSNSIQAPARNEGYADLSLLNLGIPGSIATVLMVGCAGAYLLTLIGAAVLLRRKATLRELVPVASLVLCQALWFTVPSILDLERAWSTPTLAFAAIWISGVHSLQYLWVTFYYAKRSAPGTRLPAFLAKATLAGNAVFVLPGLIFVPRLFGTDVSFEAGLSVLVFSVVNIHHFVLDGAVWKLRDGRVARVLLHGDTGIAQDSAPIRTRKLRWLSTAVWSVFALCVAIELVFVWEMEFGVQRALSSEEYERVQLAANRLEWIGRGDPSVHQLLADGLARQEYEFAVDRRLPPAQLHFFGARHHYQRSLELHPSAGAWLGLGNVHYTVGDFPQAHVAYDAALALEPRHARALTRKAELWLDEGDLMRARNSLQKAVALAPRDPRIEKVLTRLRQAEQKGDAER